MRALNAWLGKLGWAWLFALIPLTSVPAQTPVSTISNLVQLSSAASPNPTNACRIDLQALVLWVHPAEHRIAFHDSTSVEVVEMAGIGDLKPGQIARLIGNAAIAQSASGVRIGAVGPVVQNDGVHAMIEKAGSVYLSAGLNPIRLDWFNALDRSGLEVDWKGPGFEREPLSPSRFKVSSTNGADIQLADGLNFRCYEGVWEALPDFDAMTPIKTGRARGFDLQATTRNDHVGASFSGWLDVPADGLHTFWLRSDDGSQLFVGEPTVKASVIGQAELPQPIAVFPGQILSARRVWARMEGTVVFAAAQRSGVLLEIQFGSGKARVIVPRTSLDVSKLLQRRIAVSGVCSQTVTPEGDRVAGLMLADPNSIQLLPSVEASGIQVVDSNNAAGVLPTLTSAAAVHNLKREEAQRGFPVKLRGVITSVLREHQAFTIQDSTRGLYVVDFSSSRPTQAPLGEFLEVEGVTDPSLFAPVVNARRVRSLGQGQMPEPLRATWDQLVNGSLDAQYVELQGIVTGVQSNRLTLRLPGGIIRVEVRLAGTESADLRPFENALIRMRGCLFASWDYVTHEVKPGEVRVYSASIAMDAAPPEDLFSIRPKSVSDLRLFDPQASVFQRVKVMGQLVHLRANEGYLLQGGQGVRFMAKEALTNAPGDLLELVGFPDVSGPAAPIVREALTRKVGHAALPEPRRLEIEESADANLDGTMVSVEGTLVSIRQLRGEVLLEIQSGVRRFLARSAKDASTLMSLTVGSRLELRGVFAAQSAAGNSGLNVGSFELLLLDHDPVRVLARPPWWTLERLLLMLGILATGLAVTALWISQLRRKVEQRTAELGAQIQARQRLEHQREMDLERSRIARDLHDELGSGITEIGMLAARSKSASAVEERRSAYLEQMSTKARELVTALDEIVWAMNPKHDSLGSLISYFSLYADRFLGLAGIPWKLEVTGAADQAVNSRHRHQLFLAFKEALNNVVRHSAATKVNVTIGFENGRLQLTVSDNGCGFPAAADGHGMDGVANMRDRMERLGGSFEAAPGPERGTTLRFVLPTV